MPIYVRRNIKLAEAPSYGKTIFEYEPNCHGAQDYRKVAEFIDGQGVEAEEVEIEDLTAEAPIKIQSIEQPVTQVVETEPQKTVAEENTSE